MDWEIENKEFLKRSREKLSLWRISPIEESNVYAYHKTHRGWFIQYLKDHEEGQTVKEHRNWIVIDAEL